PKANTSSSATISRQRRLWRCVTGYPPRPTADNQRRAWCRCARRHGRQLASFGDVTLWLQVHCPSQTGPAHIIGPLECLSPRCDLQREEVPPKAPPRAAINQEGRL